MVMNKNTYPGLALATCLSIASTHLLAEAVPATSVPGPLDSSELQRQQEDYKEERIIEPLEPSELQRQQEEHIDERIIEPLEPSELQRQQEQHNKGTAK
jgi:hypothetical protein